MKHIVTLLLAVLMMLGACALADERADMLLAAAINELGYSATKGGYSKYGEWGGRVLRRFDARHGLSAANELRGRLDVV